MIVLDVSQLKDIISESVDIGLQSHLAMTSPGKDLVIPATAKKYLEDRGYDKKMLDVWTKNDLIHPLVSQPIGCKRPKVRYSMTEIKKTILAVHLRVNTADNTYSGNPNSIQVNI